MKKLVAPLLLPLLCLLMFTGCVGSGASDVDASTSSRRKQDDDAGPRQVCEDTSIGGTPKSFCY